MNPADLRKLQALPVGEKLMVVEVLWQSIGELGDEPSVSDAEKKELDSRWERFERDPSRALKIEQFDALVEAKRGRSEAGALSVSFRSSPTGLRMIAQGWNNPG
jgi:putative addiction module component (TIGR02574 family)